jgi:hypothetical protein
MVGISAPCKVFGIMESFSETNFFHSWRRGGFWGKMYGRLRGDWLRARRISKGSDICHRSAVAAFFACRGT